MINFQLFQEGKTILSQREFKKGNKITRKFYVFIIRISQSHVLFSKNIQSSNGTLTYSHFQSTSISLRLLTCYEFRNEYRIIILDRM